MPFIGRIPRDFPQSLAGALELFAEDLEFEADVLDTESATVIRVDFVDRRQIHPEMVDK